MHLFKELNEALKKATYDGAAALDQFRSESPRVVRKGRKRTNLAAKKLREESFEPELEEASSAGGLKFGARISKLN